MKASTAIGVSTPENMERDNKSNVPIILLLFSRTFVYPGVKDLGMFFLTVTKFFSAAGNRDVWIAFCHLCAGCKSVVHAPVVTFMIRLSAFPCW